MLVLFVLTISLLHSRIQATEAQLAKIKKLESSIEKIDPEYFQYNSDYKRHTLKNITVSFATGSSDILDIPQHDLKRLEDAGRAIVKFMREAKKTIPEAEYMLIVEGQSSRDSYPKNNELSYSRALSLVKYWQTKGIV
jgi:flagellar motor protein MotB